MATELPKPELGGRLAPSIDDGWVLNPETPFPLTICGVDGAGARRFKELLISMIDSGDHSPADAISDFVATTGLRCKELDDYLVEMRPLWDADKELDRTPYCDLETLFDDGSLLPGQGPALATRYGLRSLQFYSRNARMIGDPRPIWPTHRDRKRFESLVSLGLARIGPELKRDGKTGDGVELLPINSGPSADRLLAWCKHTQTVAELIARTFRSAVGEAAAMIHERDPAIQSITIGYELCCVTDDCACRFCARQDGKKFSVEQRPRPPFHIGCRCSVIPILT